MDGFIKLQGYDRESGKYFDLFIDVNRIATFSPNMNMVYTTIGTFTISKKSMCNLMAFMKTGVYLDLTEEWGEESLKGKEYSNFKTR